MKYLTYICNTWFCVWIAQGFGDSSGEYWLGNDFLHQVTSSGVYTLRIVLKDWENNEVYSQYDHFHTDSEERNYR